MVDDIVATVDKTDKKYDLSEVAAILDVNTSSYKNSNNASKFLVESIITVTDLSISTEPIIEFNGIPSSDNTWLLSQKVVVDFCVKWKPLLIGRHFALFV